MYKCTTAIFLSCLLSLSRTSESTNEFLFLTNHAVSWRQTIRALNYNPIIPHILPVADPSTQQYDNVQNTIPESTQYAIPSQPWMKEQGAATQHVTSTTNGVPRNEVTTQSHGAHRVSSPRAARNQPLPSAPRQPLHRTFENFSDRLFQIMGPGNLYRNMVYSPISIQNLLALVYMGSEGNTARELQAGLQLPQRDDQTQELFNRMLKNLPHSEEALVLMASKFYFSNRLQIGANWRAFANQVFNADIEPLDFGSPVSSAARINSWAAEKTLNHIQHVVSPANIEQQDMAILLNVIYFKGKWAKQFSLDDTLPQEFFSINGASRPVNTMYISDSIRYGNFPQLQAQIVELPYRDNNLSMWIILPHERQGLAEVEQRMQGVDFHILANQMRATEVILRLPKFRIEFEENMVEPLQKMNIQRLFSSSAELHGFFTNAQRVGISQVQHKAFLDVNEGGSEAAAASFAKFVPLSLPPESETFTANHPFMFVIRSPQVIYFIGHIVNL